MLPVVAALVLLTVPAAPACGSTAKKDQTNADQGPPIVGGQSVSEMTVPQSVDQRLTIELFAEHPDIVTPVGIGADEQGRILVVESNTHFRPAKYARHPSDRILALEDTDRDGRADRITTFFDGLRHAMHLTIHPSGDVYVVTRNSVIRLQDTSGDGRADTATTLMHLETKGDYPHNGLFSCAFDSHGDLFVSMGENLGEDYRLIGSDGTSVSGGGEGGNIFQARGDGSDVRKRATGFWNPVQLEFDSFGRLFTVDNDPDSRPPCRLLHIVAGGDYGYRYRNGRAGLHPFTAWNGELPGTLPMVAGTGEAPSGLLFCEHGILPEDYRGDLLVTSWGHHRVERFQLQRRGATYAASMQPVVVGPQDFRPVGIAASADGSLYISDWVDRSYELHGKGRIWRLRMGQTDEQTEDQERPEESARGLASLNRADRRRAIRRWSCLTRAERRRTIEAATRSGDPPARAAALAALVAAGAVNPEQADRFLSDPCSDIRQFAVRVMPAKLLDANRQLERDADPQVRAAALRRLALHSPDTEVLACVLKYLSSSDPFLRVAARDVLIRHPDVLSDCDARRLSDTRQQLGVLLCQRAAGTRHVTEDLTHYLSSPDADIRFLVTQWIGEERLHQHREALQRNLQRADISYRLFTATLASLALLDGVSPHLADKQRGRHYLAKIVEDPEAPPMLVRQALRGLAPDDPVLTLDRVGQLLEARDTAVRVELVRTIRDWPHPERLAILRKCFRDASMPLPVRAEAVLGLAAGRSPERNLLCQIAVGPDERLQVEALRALRGQSLDDRRIKLLRASPPRSTAARAAWLRVVRPGQLPARPAVTELQAWLQRLQGPADPAAGERVFFHAASGGCFRCHRFEGRGGDVGPDLSRVGNTIGRRRLLQSILEPSREVAPQYYAWTIILKDGRTLVGTLVRESADGTQVYADAHGKQTSLSTSQIARRRASPRSIMPDQLIDQLTDQELRDLLAFLAAPPR